MSGLTPAATRGDLRRRINDGAVLAVDIGLNDVGLSLPLISAEQSFPVLGFDVDASRTFRSRQLEQAVADDIRR